MKIDFDDGSFILVEESVVPHKVATITMCGVKEKSVVMSSSDLSEEEAEDMIGFLKKILKSVS